ncbi:DUF125-domain-containing protein [Rhizodiscina lignyota]|uniref:DUF125-domain-containing protein n=1 Tax=Rhizodiscina lignyota TaxID=1504668 RepID=A0A9P4MF23_9PEZI|nr:DUF125-domain-containing protein [Rhizodiscina lignyota]
MIRSTFSRKAVTEGSENRLSESSLESGARPPSSRKEQNNWANSDSVKNAIIGFSDGLTVPFALTAGLTSFGSQKLVVIGGIAELIAGALSMGLGAYLAASTERTAYLVREQQEIREVETIPAVQEEETYAIFEQYGLSKERVRPLVQGLKQDKEMWAKFLIDHSLKLEKPALNGAWLAAMVMALAYFLGGILPMLPYFFYKRVLDGLYTSISITALLLVSFGYVKAYVTGCGRKEALWSAAQTLIVGAIASGASFGIVWGINHGFHGGKAVQGGGEFDPNTNNLGHPVPTN